MIDTNSTDSNNLAREFEVVVTSLSSVFDKKLTDLWIEHWRHGEPSLAVEALINSLVEIEPPLTNEMQERVARLAQYDKGLLTEFREVYPNQEISLS